MSIYNDINLIEDAINEILCSEDVNNEALDILMQTKADTIKNGLEVLCKIRANKQAEIAGLINEVKRISEKAESESKSLARLEQYILSVLGRSGEKKITAGTFTVGTRTSTSVWVDPAFNNPEFMRTKTETLPDKVAIKEALKNGVALDGAALVTKENLSIK